MLARRRRKECSRFSTQLCNSTAKNNREAYSFTWDMIADNFSTKNRLLR